MGNGDSRRWERALVAFCAAGAALYSGLLPAGLMVPAAMAMAFAHGVMVATSGR